MAADGGGSRVRRQFLPGAERIDTGIVGIAGKVFLDDDNRRRLAPELHSGFTLASGSGGYSLFVRRRTSTASRWPALAATTSPPGPAPISTIPALI